jgi:PII-like signaling protein
MLTVFTTEGAATPDGERLVDTVLERARQEGLAGASVVRGVEGFGRSGRVRTTRFPDVSVDLPVIIQMVDAAARIEGFLPILTTITADELVVVQPVTIDHRPHPPVAFDDER